MLAGLRGWLGLDGRREVHDQRVRARAQHQVQVPLPLQDPQLHGLRQHGVAQLQRLRLQAPQEEDEPQVSAARRL